MADYVDHAAIRAAFLETPITERLEMRLDWFQPPEAPAPVPQAGQPPGHEIQPPAPPTVEPPALSPEAFHQSVFCGLHLPAQSVVSSRLNAPVDLVSVAAGPEGRAVSDALYRRIEQWGPARDLLLETDGLGDVFTVISYAVAVYTAVTSAVRDAANTNSDPEKPEDESEAA